MRMSDHPLTLTTIDDARSWRAAAHSRGETVVLVPTMGALHDGHLELVRRAREEGDQVIVSIFVNPTQFGPNEDFEAYPRTLELDVAKLKSNGCCDAVFAPDPIEMYPFGSNKTWVTVDRLGDHLCGATRPGHFKGVTTVVARFFTILTPDVAVFGLKDAQQFFILKRMAHEMGFPTRLAGIPTVREADGLAMSSRNRYLNASERAAAPIVNRSLQTAHHSISKGGMRDVDKIILDIEAQLLAEPTCRPDYVSVVDTEELQPLESLESGSQVLIAVAAYFGTARLIDNTIVDVP